jgi:hypothetical protein
MLFLGTVCTDLSSFKHGTKLLILINYYQRYAISVECVFMLLNYLHMAQETWIYETRATLVQQTTGEHIFTEVFILRSIKEGVGGTVGPLTNESL